MTYGFAGGIFFRFRLCAGALGRRRSISAVGLDASVLGVFSDLGILNSMPCLASCVDCSYAYHSRIGLAGEWRFRGANRRCWRKASGGHHRCLALCDVRLRQSQLFQDGRDGRFLSVGEGAQGAGYDVVVDDAHMLEGGLHSGEACGVGAAALG